MSAFDSLQPAPDWLIGELRQHKARDMRAGVAIVELDTDWAIERATRYLTEEAPVAIEGDGGDATTNRIVNRVGDFGVSPSKCLDLLEDHWDWRCVPPWEDGLKAKVVSGYKSRQNPIGCAHPLAKAEVFDTITPAPTPEPPTPAELLEFTRDVDLSKLIEAQSQYLIKGLLFPGDQSMCHGPSTAGKTFLLLDMCWHVALGREWHGCKVRKSPVLYVSLEGVDGFKKRMKACEKVFGDPGDYFARLRPRVSLVRAENPGKVGMDQIIAAAEALKAKTGESVGLIVIDTLSRAMAGDDENLQADMMHFIEQRLGVIGERTGAATMTLHHPGKDGRKERGSSTLTPSMDFVMRIERDDQSPIRTVIKQKVKDGVEGPLFSFQLDVHELGIDAEGDPVTSCTVAAAEQMSEGTQRALYLEGLARWTEQLLRGAIERGEQLNAKPGRGYFVTWVHEQRTSDEISKGDIVDAYNRFLLGPVFEHREVRDEHRRGVLRVVLK